MTMRRDTTGIHRHGAGWRAVVSLGRGRVVRRTFPAGTDVRVMQAWRQDQQARAHVRRKQRARRGTFEADARHYLACVTALTTYKERARQIGLWIDVFQQTPRDAITPALIRAQRDRWLTEPRAPGQPPVGPHTVNLRLRALSNLYTVLDGPRAENPVRDVEEVAEPESGPRDWDYATIERLIDAMPDWGRPEKGHAPPPRSLTKIRIRVLAYTGLSATSLMRVRARDVDLARGWLVVPARAKGAGAASALLPLLPPAIEAFRELAAAGGFGPFSISSMWKSFQRAARAAGVEDATPYRLRHSFATVAYDLTEDEHLVMLLLQHRALKTSAKYRQRAIARVLQRKVARLGAALGQHSGTIPGGEKRISVDFRGRSALISARVKAALAARKARKDPAKSA